MRATLVTGLVAAALWTSISAIAQTPSPADRAPAAVGPGSAPVKAPSSISVPTEGGGATAAPSGGSPGAVATAGVPPVPPTREMAVSSVVEKELVGPGGTALGEVEKVVESTADQKRYLVVSSGGILGFFEDEVVVPLDQVIMQNDRIAVRDLTQEQLQSMPEFDADRYRDLGESQRITIAEAR